MPLKPYTANVPISPIPPGDPAAPVTFGFARKTPHYHCPTCWGEEFRVNAIDDVLCAKCHPAPVMLVCVPEICGSS